MSNRDAAIKVVKKLRGEGFQALLAGGCVRDMLLCRAANDHDVATDARPEDVSRLFRRTLQVGAKFGVVIVLLNDKQVEVATFRTETGYIDGRHPDKVEFSDAREDAIRRDFTINGMFYDPIGNKVLDFTGGQEDLDRRVIRTIGNAQERFSEDYLRMLRAVRFSTQLKFEIEGGTFAAIRKNAKNITKISGERICMELQEILTDTNRSAGMRLLIESGLAGEIFPALSAAQTNLAVKVLGHLRKKTGFALAIASVFAGCDTDAALEMCELLKLSRDQSKEIKYLLANRGKLLEDLSLAHLKMHLASPYFRDLFEFERAISKARVAGRKGIKPLIILRRRIRELGDVELTPRPLLDGHEIMSLGAPAGPRLGHLAEEMYIAQLEGVLQDKSQAEQWVRNWLVRHKENMD